jgi:hypothetical protein
MASRRIRKHELRGVTSSRTPCTYHVPPLQTQRSSDELPIGGESPRDEPTRLTHMSNRHLAQDFKSLVTTSCARYAYSV